MIGQTLGHYRIDDVLGEGAMGVVYRAFDTRLHRPVAIKVLTGSGSTPDERRRLLREARAAAPLNHPAIATIYDVADLDDASFIVMELVEGETLSARSGTMGDDPLGLARLGLTAIQGLRAAHERGVVHGDIKPDNLMIRSDGSLKILDFGVSRRLPRADRDVLKTVAETIHEGGALAAGQDLGTLVAPGEIAGTLQYMAPEQMRGEPVDGRADLYSLAIVLQELATGRRPFDAPSAIAVMARALGPETAVVDELSRSLPIALTRILTKLLSKSVSERPETAQEAEVDVQMAIAALESGVSADEADRPVVAVLPFQLLAGSEDDEFLRIALAQAVTHGLAERGELAVRPTSAVTRYLDSYEPHQVATDLKAGVLVEGTIQRLGPSLRVQVQAWDAEAGATLLSIKRDARMDELFDLQDHLARDIVESLTHETSGSAESHAPPQVGEGVDAEAFELYLRAGERLLRATEYDSRAAVDQLERAVELDPDFADAWARLSAAQLWMDVLFEPGGTWDVAAKTSVSRALALDPGNAEAWSSQGRILWSPREGYQNEEALRHLGAACRHHAPPHDGLLWYATILAHVGLHEEAEEWIRRALDQQPDDVLARLVLGEILCWRGDFQEGAELYAGLMTIDPSAIFTQLWYPIGLIYAGELNEAGTSLDRAQRSFGEDAMFHAGGALVAARRGDVDAARDGVQATIDCVRSVSHQHHAFHYAAAAAAEIGDASQAVALLRRAMDTGFPNHPAFRADPHLQRISEAPEYTEFMEELGQRYQAIRTGFGAAAG